MPELPDIETYLEALRTRIEGRVLRRVQVANPFLLRTVDPPIEAFEGKRVVDLRRLGKRIAIGLEDELFLVIHLMVAGRLHWALTENRREAPPPEAARLRRGFSVKAWGGPGGKISAKIALAAFEFEDGTLILTEAGTKRQASLHTVRGEAALRLHDPGGLEVLGADLAAFRGMLERESHTLKRSLTDPRLFSGIGNAYSDEILHRARLSPLANSRKLTDEEIERLHLASRGVLLESLDRLRREAGAEFPEGVTAFRPWHAVHGRYKKPCPVCRSPVQRIRYAENETNYCPTCQTGGKLLADRSLSRLLKGDWPRTLEELERRRGV